MTMKNQGDNIPETKDIRLVLKRKQDIEAFNRAKLKAEQELGMVMTDNEYGRRVLVLALREMGRC